MANEKFITHMLEGVEIGQRFKDGYLNATSLSKAFRAKTGKRREPNDWIRLTRTQEMMGHLSQTTGIPVVSLVQTIEGRNGGTYLHPRLSIRFAIWLDDDFGLAVEDFIATHGREFAAFAASRNKGKGTRRIETDAIQRAGFDKPGYYVSATEAAYRGLFGMDATKLKVARGVPDDGSLRDHMTYAELNAIEFVEMLVPQIVEKYRGQSFSGAYKEILDRSKALRAVMLPSESSDS
jgi:hypothetical protein